MTTEQCKVFTDENLWLFYFKRYSQNLKKFRTFLTVEIIISTIFDLVFFTHLKNHRAFMNVIHIKQLLYYYGCSFPGSELHVSYDCKAMAQNMHPGPFLTQHFVCVCTKPWGTCNCTTHHLQEPQLKHEDSILCVLI